MRILKEIKVLIMKQLHYFKKDLKEMNSKNMKEQ